MERLGGDKPQGGTLLDAVKAMQGAIKKLNKAAEQAAAQAALEQVDDLLKGEQDLAGVPLIVGEFQNVDAKALREVAQAIKNKKDSYCLVLGSNNGGKAVLLAMASADVIERGVGAGAVGALAKMLGGGGDWPADQAKLGVKMVNNCRRHFRPYHHW